MLGGQITQLLLLGSSACEQKRGPEEANMSTRYTEAGVGLAYITPLGGTRWATRWECRTVTALENPKMTSTGSPGRSSKRLHHRSHEPGLPLRRRTYYLLYPLSLFFANLCPPPSPLPEPADCDFFGSDIYAAQSFAVTLPGEAQTQPDPRRTPHHASGLRAAYFIRTIEHFSVFGLNVYYGVFNVAPELVPDRRRIP